jgi:hypothetical protein
MVCTIALRSPLSDPRRVLTCPESRHHADNGCACFASVSPIAAETRSRTDRERSGSAGDCNLDVIHLPAFILEPDIGKRVVISDGLKIWLSFKPNVNGAAQATRSSKLRD